MLDWGEVKSKAMTIFLILNNLLEVVVPLHQKIAYCKDIVSNLQHNPPKQRWKFTIVAYFYSLIDIASAINILYLHKDTTGIPILYRSFLEAYVDLYNLVHDPKYGYRLEVNKNKEWSRLLTNHENPYLDGVFNDEDWNTFIEKLKVDKESADPQYKPLKPSEKFKLAELQDAYETLYNELCSNAHNNLRSVYERFLKKEANGSKAEMCMASVLTCIDEALDLLKKTSILKV